MQKRTNENQFKQGLTSATQKILLHSRRNKNNKNGKKIGKEEQMMKNKRWKIWSAVFSVVFVLTIIVGSVAMIVLFDRLNDLPDLNKNMNKVLTSKNSIVMDHMGNEVADLAESSLVIIPTYEEIPQSLIDAFTATEDARFFRHHGIDGPRTMQAVLGTFIFKSGDSGGSTITQQLVKQTVLGDKIADEEYKHSVKRKIDEWILAFILERSLSKEDIFLSYLNNAIVYGRFGGAGTAAKRFYNKRISELTIPEAALLAGIPQLPADNNPFYNIDKATERYNEVLTLMARHGYISPDEEKAAKNIPLADIVMRNQAEFTNENAGYFSGVEAELQGIFTDNKDGEEDPVPSYYRGLKIFTEMVPEQQAFANKIMETQEYVDWQSAAEYLYDNSYGGGPMTEKENYNFQGAFTVVNVKTGAIPAVGASRNVREAGQNLAVTGYRSPGSSIKPIIDYTPAVELLGWGAHHLMNDRPTFYGNGTNEVYNYNQSKHKGLITMAKAIGDSVNTTAVQAIQQVGIEEAARISSEMGISNAWSRYQKGELGESAALGGGLEVSTKEMAEAYATLANGGIHNKAHMIKRIENIDTGELLWEYKENPKEVVKQSTAATMTQALIESADKGTMAGGGRKQVLGAIQFAGKTGTSSYSAEEIKSTRVSNYGEKDHWHAGYSPTYAIASWTGLQVEGKEVLDRTGGNHNRNKAVGSYMLASWMNEFANDGARFDFLGAANASNSRGSIGTFNVHADNNSKTVAWTVPPVQLPSGFNEKDNETLGGIIYNVTFNTNAGSWSMSTTETQIAYPGNFFDTGTVSVTANLNNPESGKLVDPSTVTVAGLANPEPKKPDDKDKENPGGGNDNNENAQALPQQGLRQLLHPFIVFSNMLAQLMKHITSIDL